MQVMVRQASVRLVLISTLLASGCRSVAEAEDEADTTLAQDAFVLAADRRMQQKTARKAQETRENPAVTRKPAAKNREVERQALEARLAELDLLIAQLMLQTHNANQDPFAEPRAQRQRTLAALRELELTTAGE